jgi:hypothetical protein
MACAVSMQIATYKICAVRMGDSKDSGEVEVPPEVAGLPAPGGNAGSDGSATVPLTEVPPGDLGNDNPQVRAHSAAADCNTRGQRQCCHFAAWGSSAAKSPCHERLVLCRQSQPWCAFMPLQDTGSTAAQLGCAHRAQQ